MKKCPKCGAKMIADGDDFICSKYPFCVGRIYTRVKNTCGNCGKPFPKKPKANVTHCPECVEMLRIKYGWVSHKTMPVIGKCPKCGKPVKQFHEGTCKLCFVQLKKGSEKKKYSMTGIKARG